MSDTKIVGIKKAIHDMICAPKGWHCEMWAKRIDANTVEVWTSEYLTRGSWTTGIVGWKRIDLYVRQYRDIGYTWTKSIGMAVAEEVKE